MERLVGEVGESEREKERLEKRLGEVEGQLGRMGEERIQLSRMGEEKALLSRAV